MRDTRHRHRAIYDTHAAAFDARRARGLFERAWLDRFLAHVPPGGRVLDLGCGAGEPVARYLVGQGRRVTGLDFAPAMLAIARRRMPDERWIAGDMRALDLGERFDGIVGWDSFFHLTKDEQRRLIPRLGRHLAPGGALLLSVGPAEGEALGEVEGEAVYHASLSRAEYARRLGAAGIGLAAFVARDPDCDGHSVLLAVARRPR